MMLFYFMYEYCMDNSHIQIYYLYMDDIHYTHDIEYSDTLHIYRLEHVVIIIIS